MSPTATATPGTSKMARKASNSWGYKKSSPRISKKSLKLSSGCSSNSDKENQIPGTSEMACKISMMTPKSSPGISKKTPKSSSKTPKKDSTIKLRFIQFWQRKSDSRNLGIGLRNLKYEPHTWNLEDGLKNQLGIIGFWERKSTWNLGDEPQKQPKNLEDEYRWHLKNFKNESKKQPKNPKDGAQKPSL